MIVRWFKFKVFITSFFCLSIIISCNKQSPRDDIEEKYGAFIKDRDSVLVNLSIEKKQDLDSVFQNVKSTDTFKRLILKKDRAESNLLLLTTLAVTSSSLIASNGTWSIPGHLMKALNEDERKFLQNLLVTSLISKGFDKNILDLFERYKGLYKYMGDKGDIIVDSEGKELYRVSKNYNLSYFFLQYFPNDKEALDAASDGIKKKITFWKEEDITQDYKYPFLNTKKAYYKHLKDVYPESTNLPKYTIETTAQTLFDVYNVNEIAADEELRGKVIAIKGTIQNIGKDIMGKPYVSLATNNYMGSVICYFYDSQGLIELQKGDLCKIVGLCDGLLVTNVLIKNCEIEN